MTDLEEAKDSLKPHSQAWNVIDRAIGRLQGGSTYACCRIVGGDSYLVNDAGAIKSVTQASGEIKDVPRTPTKHAPQGPSFRL